MADGYGESPLSHQPWRQSLSHGHNPAMRAVIQRVSSASVRVGDRDVGAIGPGLLAFVGVERGDGGEDADYIAGKIRDLRVFEEPGDATKRLNRSVGDVGGAVLV